MSAIRKSSSVSLLGLWASIFFVTSAVVDAVVALSNAHEISLIEAAKFGQSLTPALAESQDARQRLLAGIEISIGLLAAIIFLIWVNRANRNARSLGVEGMQYTPGWSVGWFFVPIAFLFKPYLVFRELWKASQPSPDGTWHKSTVSPLLGLWWSAFVASNLVQYSAWPILFGDRSLERSLRFGTDVPERWLLTFYQGRLFANFLDIAVCVLTVVVVVSITDFQEQRRRGETTQEDKREQ